MMPLLLMQKTGDIGQLLICSDKVNGNYTSLFNILACGDTSHGVRK
jgi:hypothetical protein